ncbi:hypothetical protein Tco_0446266, partial [Tanacetum coccineum]
MGSYSMTKFSEIAYRCLHGDREKRPVMDIVAKELEETLNVHVKESEDSDDKKKLVLHLQEGLHFDKDKQFFSINDDGKKYVMISARKFLDCKESLFHRSRRFLKLAGYPNYQDFQGTKCRIEVSMLSVGTMYTASLVFKYSWKRAEHFMPVMIKWKMEELSVHSTHYAELILENWYKIRMWHFMNHGLIETFDVVLEELSYYQKTDMSAVQKKKRLIKDIDDVVDEYWEKKLPLSDKPFDYTTKKELYLSLCQGFLGCNGQLWFSLCKSTSGICSILPAAHIISPNRNLETRYLSQSRFKEVVRLEIQYDYCFSCRLGSFMFSPHHTYACYLVFRYKDNQVPSNDASFYTSKCNSRDNIMIQGMEFRPVVHDGSYLMAERSANRNHDKMKEDEYWEKLPPDYPHLIEMSDIPLNYTTKKELYFLFRHGFLANNGQL